MAIAAALNILVNSPTESLRKDLQAHKLSLTTFAKSVNNALGGALTDVANDAKRMSTALDIAFKEGAIGALALAGGMDKVAAVQKYLTAGGDSYAAMQKDAARLTDQHTSAIDKQVSALERLQAMRNAGMITPETFDAEARDVNRNIYASQWAALEKKAADNDEIVAAAKHKRELAMRADWARLERLGRENDEIAGERRNKRELGYRAQWAALERKARESDEIADNIRSKRRVSTEVMAAARGREQARHNSLIADANRLNAKHASALEVLRQKQLQLNAVKATSALTERAYAAELRAATLAYREQASIAGKLGLTSGNLKSAAGLFNPWFLAAGAVGSAVKVMGDFEQSMSRVKAMSAATGAEMLELTRAASELGRTTVFSAKDAAEGMSALALAGYNANQILQASLPTMQLAAIGQMEVGDAAEVTSRIMAGMKIPAHQLSDAVDAIAVAASNSVNTVEQLGEALKFVGPVATQAGLSLSEVMASLMVLGNAGLSGEMGGTSLRNSILQMVNPTDKSAAAIKRLGIAFETAEGKMMPMLHIIEQFDSALSGMGQMEQLETLAEIFKTRSVTGMASLISGGPEKFAEMLSLQSEREGIAGELERVLNDNLWGDIELLGSSLSGIATDAEACGLMLRFFTNTTTAVVDTIVSTFQLLQSSIYAVAAGLSKVIGWILERVPFSETIQSAGSFLSAFGDEMWIAAGDALANSAKNGQAAIDAMARGLNLDDSGIVRDRLESRVSAIDSQLSGEDALATVLAKQRDSAEEMLTSVRDRIDAAKNSTLQAKLGNEAAERLLLLEDGRKTIAESIAELQSKGVNDAIAWADAEQAKLDNMIHELEIEQQLAKLWQERSKLIKDAEASQLAAAIVGMTSGQQALFGLGADATDDDRAAAARLDNFESIKSITEMIVGASQQALDLQRSLIDGWSKYDTEFAKAYDKAALDSIFTAEENSALRKLDAILQQNEALEKQAEKRKKERDELQKYASDMKRMAADLVTKHNPVKAFREDFIDLQTMLQRGLVDDDTYDAALELLTNKTMKSAGPRNIKYAGAVTEDSAEGYSATLRTTRNPEFDELRKQTDEIKKSRQTLAKIAANTDKLQNAEAFDIPL